MVASEGGARGHRRRCAEKALRCVAHACGCTVWTAATALCDMGRATPALHLRERAVQKSSVQPEQAPTKRSQFILQSTLNATTRQRRTDPRLGLESAWVSALNSKRKKRCHKEYMASARGGGAVGRSGSGNGLIT